MTRSATGVALKTLRVAAGLTIDRAADMAGVSASYLSRAENGEVQPTSKWIAHVTEIIGQHIASTERVA